MTDSERWHVIAAGLVAVMDVLARDPRAYTAPAFAQVHALVKQVRAETASGGGGGGNGGPGVVIKLG